MFCIHCGKELEDGSKFCIHCGEHLDEEVETVEEAAETAVEAADETVEAAVETAAEAVEEVAEAAAETAEDTAQAVADTVEEVKEAAEAAVSVPEEAPVEVENAGGTKAINVSELLKNKKVLIIAAAAVVVLLLIIIIVCASVAAGSSGGTLALKGTYYLYDDAGEKIVYYNGKEVKGTDLSSSARIVATSVDGSKAVLRDDVDALYYLSGDKISKITEDFDLTINMSADGSAVCYMYDGTLFIYKGGKSTKIGDIDNLATVPVISPNGDTVAYAESDGGKYSTFAWKGGKVTDLDAKIVPFAVSNGGGIIYGVDKSMKLCYIKKLKKDSAESVKSMSGSAPILSYDNTQIMFTADNGGVYYFDSSLKEDIKVSGDSISIIYPQGSASSMTNFKSFIAYSDGKIYNFTFKGKDFDKNSLVSYCSDYMLSADGKTLVYTLGGDLYRTSVSNTDKKTLLAEEVDSFDADRSLKNVYFKNDDDALRYADGKSKNGKKIIDDVGRFIVTPDGVCVFVDDDDELQYSAGGGDKKKAGLNEIEGLSENNGVIYVVSDGDFYISTNGKKFDKK